ncbi:DNA ligase D [Salinarimonas soli]|uniref:DNA ligase (ATP) n=1 Tax=Salinarimonas soli TaxID=1638099 RepID=A0A5B2VAD3_9HYPH|nr:DNA ligase D [Salinarimonas soli]KAA2235555.1 DNA ligase D [Salinarimonas soli]
MGTRKPKDVIKAALPKKPRRTPSPKPPQGKAGPGAEPLEEYRAKRSFERSPEPQGAKAASRAGENQFVVQKHAARRLHYDLRLELDGVLKSWAVTRGPSLVPGDKRLAVQTEDHPLDYIAFEGVIPAGEYGGGTMIVWDHGRWSPEGDPSEALATGRLTFTLSGSRLRGRWHLVRTRSRDKKEQWLLIKSDDEHARAPGALDILEEHQTSLLTGRTNTELAAGGEVRSDHAARARATRPKLAAPKGARKALLPTFVEPCLAKLAEEAPSGSDWLHEIKFDGYRLQARIDGTTVGLLTRKGLDWTARFAPVADALRELGLGSALIDGELVVEDDTGVSSFSALQADIKAGRGDRLVFYAFDLLYLDGTDLRSLALRERKDLLIGALDDLPAGGTVRWSEHLEEDGEALIRHACRMGLEGIVSKRAGSPYVSGRVDHWRKTKCTQRQEFVVAGYLPSTTSRKAVGSLVLGAYDGDRLVHVGRVGTGFPATTAGALWSDLDALSRPSAPFADPLPSDASRGVRWVRPDLVAEVEYRGWTADSLLRHASFKGLRDDKDPREVVIEREGTAEPAKARDLAGVALTHPDRVLWPDQGLTKQGLAGFYAEIADWILPHVVDRPLALVRCPSGTEKACFFAKHPWAGMHEAVSRVRIGDEEGVAIHDLAGLLALVQAGVLEIHPWGASLADVDRPDRIVMDLDPDESVGFAEVIAAAREVRDRLGAFGLESFVKTTGGKGLHVVAPLTPAAGWDEVKAFTAALAEAMERDSPGRFTRTLEKSARTGRIFIDYLRNGRGATAIAAYSTRARPGAPVAVPLGWEELSPSLTPGFFTVANLPTRLRHLQRDPWEPVRSLRQRLPTLRVRRRRPDRRGQVPSPSR